MYFIIVILWLNWRKIGNSIYNKQFHLQLQKIGISTKYNQERVQTEPLQY